jgi:plastocyanin
MTLTAYTARRRLLGIAFIVLLGTAFLAGCGDDDDDHMGSGMSGNAPHGMGTTDENRAVVPGAREIPVVADSLTFAPQKIDLRAGEDVTIVLISKDLAHDFVVEDVGHIVHAGRGKTRRGGLTIDEPGKYDFWCSVDGHREGGMTGTITVTA